jgi:hypothetical protein
MSISVEREVWNRSRAKGNSLLVLLAIAYHVNEHRATEEGDWTAWPSQGVLAEKCNCSDRAIRRAITELKSLGEVRETGEHVGRGARILEITLSDEPWTLPSTLDESAGVGEGEAQPRRIRPPGRTNASGTPADTSGGADESAGQVGRQRPQNKKEPEGNSEVEKEENTSSPPSAVLDMCFPPGEDNSDSNGAWKYSDTPAKHAAEVRDLEKIRGELEADLQRWQGHEPTIRALDNVKAELLALDAGLEVEA